jgi:hypothetical protein
VVDTFPFLSISVHPTIWEYIDSRGWAGHRDSGEQSDLLQARMATAQVLGLTEGSTALRKTSNPSFTFGREPLG